MAQNLQNIHSRAWTCLFLRQKLPQERKESCNVFFFPDFAVSINLTDLQWDMHIKIHWYEHGWRDNGRGVRSRLFNLSKNQSVKTMCFPKCQMISEYMLGSWWKGSVWQIIMIVRSPIFKKNQQHSNVRKHKAGMSHPSQIILTHRDLFFFKGTEFELCWWNRLVEEEPWEEKYRSRPWPEQVLG